MDKLKNIFIVFLFIVFLFFYIGVQAKESSLYVKVENENLRATPNGKKIAEILKSTEMKVIEEKGSWVKVQISGWMWKPSTTSSKSDITKLKTEQKKTKGAWALSKNEEERIIKSKCTQEWPDDFKMRAYCVKKQKEGLATLKLGKPGDISERDFNVIRSKCTSEWPDDFKMRAYCERKQFEAVRELR